MIQTQTKFILKYSSGLFRVQLKFVFRIRPLNLKPNIIIMKLFI